MDMRASSGYKIDKHRNIFKYYWGNKGEDNLADSFAKHCSVNQLCDLSICIVQHCLRG
jgi:hypothetical protein